MNPFRTFILCLCLLVTAGTGSADSATKKTKSTFTNAARPHSTRQPMPAILAAMPVPNLYLDTSTIGGYFDDEWQEATRELWRQMEAGQWHFLTSAVTTDELTAAPERVRELFANTFPVEAVLGISVESERLATAYMSRHILPPKYTDDARHVAVCTVAQIEYLVSWNFKHLVNVQREAGFNAVNLLQGYRSVRIVNPLELIYGNQDQNL